MLTEKPPSNQIVNDEIINCDGNHIVTDSGKLVIKDNLLHKYMQQNEGLRAENAQLHQQRERLIHDHELVCRENDRLRKRLSIPSQNGDQLITINGESNGNNDNFQDNGIIINGDDDETINEQQQQGGENEDEYNNNHNTNGLTNGLTNKGINKKNSNNLRREEERRPSLVAINGNSEERTISNRFKFNDRSGNGKLINGINNDNGNNHNLVKGNVNEKQSNEFGLEVRGTSAATKTRFRRK